MAATQPKTAAQTKAAEQTKAQPKTAMQAKTRQKSVAPEIAPSKSAKAAPKTVAAASTTEGILMVSTKPPCSLVIDGKATKLTTPQRAIRLAPGVHDITFINASEKIRKNVSVTISASKTSKLIKDFTH